MDVLYGTGRDYLDAFLKDAGVQVELLNGYRDAYFGGHRPEPSEEFFQELSARVKATGAHLGLAVDADADRFGVMDAAGDLSRRQYRPGPALRLSHRDPGLGRRRGPQRGHHPPAGPDRGPV